MTVKLITFGCRLNTYESEVIREHACKAGLEEAIIFNTCAVTKEAERQALQSIRKARREYPGMQIIVTGCSAQLNPQRFQDMPEVDRVLGNTEKMQAKNWHPEVTESVQVTDIQEIRETATHLAMHFNGRTRAFLQIQNGCDHRCTFCIIPYARGPNRSVPLGHLVENIRMLVQKGFQEVVLTGVDITAYGGDLPSPLSLSRMLERLLHQVPELKRLRLSSLDPAEIEDHFFDLFAREPRLMPHLHLSLQAGDAMILKRMKRRHTPQDILDFCTKARQARPEVVFGADVIAGFPTETKEMFQNTCEVLASCGIPLLHVFPYSPRPGTPAARMPQVVGGVIKARAGHLRALGQQHLQAVLFENIGKELSVLLEKPDFGHSETFLPVRLNQKADMGTICKVRVLDVKNGQLWAEPLVHQEVSCGLV